MFNLSPFDLPPHIKIRKSARARRLALRLDNKDRVFHLVIPRGTPMRKAQIFALTHENWMKEKLSDLPDPILLEDGAVVPILGQLRTISVEYDRTLKTTSIELRRKSLIVRTNLADPAPRIVRFLKMLAKEQLTLMAHEKAALIRRRIREVAVRDTKSRWGSCSADGKLSFSWRLIFAPYETIDYIVAHEVAHLRHLNHGPNFWRLCEELSDDYEDGKYWIDHNGAELMRYSAH